MGKFSVTHEINCNVETFWKTFLDKTFNEKLYLEGLGFPAFKIVDQTETDAKIIRKVAGTPGFGSGGSARDAITRRSCGGRCGGIGGRRFS